VIRQKAADYQSALDLTRPLGGLHPSVMRSMTYKPTERMYFLIPILFALAASPLHAETQDDPARDQAAADVEAGQEIRKLITQLNADTFLARDEATRAIAAYGAKAVPFLIESLDNPSAELRSRAMSLLAKHGSFELVAPYLLRAIDRPGGQSARTILQDRCRQQLDESGEIPNCERLFRFWGTTRDKYRYESLTAFQNAKTTAQLSLVVEPILHIRAKVNQFEDLIARMAKLSVASEHRHTPGYIVAETMAQGLRTGRAECVTFSTNYVEALETLAVDLSNQKDSPNSIKQEIANRASWSQGAATFLVQLLDPESQPSKALAQAIHVAPQSLHDSFFQGLRAVDTARYARGVGRVHIVDLLNETIRSWPAMPDQGAVADLVDCVIDSAHEGNKPKALVFLEALDGCRKLQQRGLDLNQPPVRQLADHLLTSARSAQNHREYFPTYSVHGKLVGILERGISFESEAFPREYLDHFVQGGAESTSEDQRQLLDKYVTILDRLTKAGVNFEQATARPVLRALRRHLANGSDQVSTIAQRLAELPSTENIPAERVLEMLSAELNVK
jgi:hypothetical protein